MTPLLYASRDGRMETARMLLDAGADINSVMRTTSRRSSPRLPTTTRRRALPDRARRHQGRGLVHGRTALWAAVETRNMDVDNATFVNSIDRAPFWS